MKDLACPNCGYHEYEEMTLKSSGFCVKMLRCFDCDSLFSEEHGKIELIKKEITCSFL